MINSLEADAIYQVDVINQRPLSQFIAMQTGIVHESPQVLLFIHGEVIDHASHHSISRKLMEEYINKI